MELDELVARPIDLESVRPIFERLEFRTLMERVTKLVTGEANGNGGAAPAPVAAAPATEVAEAPAAPTSRMLLDEELATWLERAVAAEPAGLGLSLDVVDGRVIGAGIATSDESLRLAWQPDRAEYAPFEAWLASEAPKIMTDAKGQLKALTRSGLAFDGLVLDTLVAGWMVRPILQEKSLADLVAFYLGETVPQSDPALLVPEEGMDAGAPEYAWYTLRLAPVVLRSLSESSRRLLAEVEMPLVPVLAAMELRGVTVDHAELAALSSELGERAAALAQSAFAEIGREVNLGSPKQLQEVLFDQLGMPKTRATKTGYTTDASALADLQDSNPHPFLGYLLEHRDATKLRQIVESLDKAIAADGRIHTTYGQIGAATGRMSSNDPNLQNIPIRTAEGRRIRKAFRHGPEYAELLTADYSQIEMRIMAHLSGDPGLIEAFNAGEDLHRFVGRARVLGRPRRRDPAHAHQGEGDVVRPRLRAQRLRAVQAAAHRPGRGDAAHEGVLRAVRCGARLPARRRRAGEDRRLHRDDLRSPSAVPRPREPEPRAPRERRASGAELADPGLGGRHHQDRDGARRSRHRRAGARQPDAHAGARRARVRGRAGGVRRARRGGPRRAWRTPPTSRCRSTCRLGRGANWDDAAH